MLLLWLPSVLLLWPLLVAVVSSVPEDGVVAVAVAVLSHGDDGLPNASPPGAIPSTTTSFY